MAVLPGPASLPRSAKLAGSCTSLTINTSTVFVSGGVDISFTSVGGLREGEGIYEPATVGLSTPAVDECSMSAADSLEFSSTAA